MHKFIVKPPNKLSFRYNFEFQIPIKQLTNIAMLKN